MALPNFAESAWYREMFCHFYEAQSRPDIYAIPQYHALNSIQLALTMYLAEVIAYFSNFHYHDSYQDRISFNFATQILIWMSTYSDHIFGWVFVHGRHTSVKSFRARDLSDYFLTWQYGRWPFPKSRQRRMKRRQPDLRGYCVLW